MLKAKIERTNITVSANRKCQYLNLKAKTSLRDEMGVGQVPWFKQYPCCLPECKKWEKNLTPMWLFPRNPSFHCHIFFYGLSWIKIPKFTLANQYLSFFR